MIRRSIRSLRRFHSFVQISLCELLTCDLYSSGNKEAFFNFVHSQPPRHFRSPSLLLLWASTKAGKKKKSQGPESLFMLFIKGCDCLSWARTASKQLSQVGLVLFSWLRAKTGTRDYCTRLRPWTPILTEQGETKRPNVT